MFDPFEYLALRHRDGMLKTIPRSIWAESATTCPATCACRTWAFVRRCSKLVQAPGEYGGALLRPRRHLGREEEYFDAPAKIRAARLPRDGRRPDYMSDCYIAGPPLVQGMGTAQGRELISLRVSLTVLTGQPCRRIQPIGTALCPESPVTA